MRVDVRRQTRLGERRFLMELAAPSAAFKGVRPGQFLHVRVGVSCDPLLRRPLSVHDIVPGRKKGEALIKVLYEVVGRGTQLLSEKAAGSSLDVLGPLGNGFDVERIAAAERIVLVAGGMGVAPLFFLARKIKEAQSSKSKIQMTVLIGAKTKEHLVGEKMFKALGCEVRIATDDGSKGHEGFVTELLENEVTRHPSPVTSNGKSQEPRDKSDTRCVVCACGPKGMLAAVSAIAEEATIPVFVSLEEFMGCGLGACLGCVIRTTAGHQRICHDGPVFAGTEVIWKR